MFTLSCEYQARLLERDWY